MLSTLIGAVIGALISGAIAYLVARQTARNTAALADADRKAKERALGFRLLMKLKLLVDNSYSIHKQIEECIQEAENAGIKGPLVFKLRPMAGNSDQEIIFEPDELAILLNAQQNALLSELTLIVQRQKALDVALDDYRYERRTFLKMLPPPVMHGNIGAQILNEQQKAEIEPALVDVNTMAEGLRSIAKEQFDACREASGRLGPALRQALRDETFPVLGIRPGALIPETPTD